MSQKHTMSFHIEFDDETNQYWGYLEEYPEVCACADDYHGCRANIMELLLEAILDSQEIRERFLNKQSNFL